MFEKHTPIGAHPPVSGKRPGPVTLELGPGALPSSAFGSVTSRTQGPSDFHMKGNLRLSRGIGLLPSVLPRYRPAVFLMVDACFPVHCHGLWLAYLQYLWNLLADIFLRPGVYDKWQFQIKAFFTKEYRMQFLSTSNTPRLQSHGCPTESRALKKRFVCPTARSPDLRLGRVSLRVARF